MTYTQKQTELINALRANNCAHFNAPRGFDQQELVELLTVALIEAVRGENAAHDSVTCKAVLYVATFGNIKL